MSNYSTLKAAISAVIKENNNHEITGQVLQTTLLAMVDSLAGGYLFKGIATPATVVGTPDENVFYIGGGGLYSNFGATPVNVPDCCIGIFTYNGSFENHIIPTGGVFDISAYNAVGGTPATYEDLTAALGTGGANIPDYLRKGGMSVKFIQGNAPSSDNNYLQYRCIPDEFSANPYDWALMEGDIYVGNSDYIDVRVDKNNKILWAIKIDGTIFYGAGCPPQVKEYIEEKIEELGLDKVDDIVTFLGDLLEGDKTLQDLLDEKVDKEEGKSLIDEDVADGEYYVENSNYMSVEVDGDNKILGGRKADGTKFENCPVETPSYVEENTENNDFIDVVTDGENKIIEAITKDGKKHISDFDDPTKALIKDIAGSQENNSIIMCIGDSVTAGMGMVGGNYARYGEDPYPAQLYTMIVDGNYKGYTVINRGHSGEAIPAMAVSSGALAGYIKESVQLPNDMSWVVLSVGSNPNLAMHYKTTGNLDWNVVFTSSREETSPVFIDGNYYDMKVELNDSVFTCSIRKKDISNTATEIPAGALIITSNTKNPYLQIIYGGINGAAGLSYEKWSTVMDSMLKINGGLGLIIGFSAIWSNWTDLDGGSVSDKYNDFRDKSYRLWGDRFLDLYDLFYRHALDYCLAHGYYTDKTQEELDSMRELLSQHILPAEMSYDYSHQGDVHLSKEGYYAMAKIIFDRLVSLQYITN